MPKCFNIKKVSEEVKKRSVQVIGDDSLYSRLKDKNNNCIFVGDRIKGFDREFIVKKGVKEIEKVSPSGDINLVLIPCIYLECLETKETSFPIVKNYKGKMREYFNKRFYKSCILKKFFKEPIEYSIYVAGINREYVEMMLDIDRHLIKKGVRICEKELNNIGRSDVDGANQGFLNDLFFVVHWEEKQIIVMYKNDK